MNMHTTCAVTRTQQTSQRSTPNANKWHETSAVVGIIAVMADLSSVAQRLEVIRGHQPALHTLAEPAALIGCVSQHLVPKDFARGFEYRSAPSDGTCLVAGLWNTLDELRYESIIAQLGGEGLPLYTDAGLTQSESDAAYARYRQIDADAPSVGQAFAALRIAGRA